MLYFLYLKGSKKIVEKFNSSEEGGLGFTRIQFYQHTFQKKNDPWRYQSFKIVEQKNN
jgi:hypothetical protein